MASEISGKALLSITRLDSDRVPYEVWAFVQTASGGPGCVRDLAMDCACENFQLLETESLPVPPGARRLRAGETGRYAVSYVFEHHTSWDGEGDVNLYYRRSRTLRVQRRRAKKFATSRK